MSNDAVVVKKVKRKGESCWIYSIMIAKKWFTCETTYKSERSALRAGANVVARYLKEA